MADCILAIDPGLTGAWALYWPETGNLKIGDMPLVEVGPKAHEVDGSKLAQVAREKNITLAIIEKVHSMPKQGVASTFKFGQAYGAALACLQAWSLPVYKVPPQVWKKALGLTGKDKDAARLKALEAFPAFAFYFARKKDHGRAEAALLALWGANAEEACRAVALPMEAAE